MKKTVLEFIRRGMVAASFGPVVLAIIYLGIQKYNPTLSIGLRDVCIGIFSTSALAFVIGGMNVVYQIDQLPLVPAVLIHGLVLYVSYLVTYLVNDWLASSMVDIIVFTCIFVFGFLLIWAVIYTVMRKNTERINVVLEEKRAKLSH